MRHTQVRMYNEQVAIVETPVVVEYKLLIVLIHEKGINMQNMHQEIFRIALNIQALQICVCGINLRI